MTRTKAVIVPVTPFQQNCTLLWCEVTKRAVVIDPGGDLPEVERAITRAGVSVDKIWLTHGHVDHVAGASDLKTNLKVSIEGPHKDDLFLLQHVAETGRSYGMWNASNVTPDRWLEEGDQVQIGELTFNVLHCPGHSPGSIVYFNPVQRLAIVGDVLFAGSIGRTDLPGGDYQQLIESIKDKLLPLGDDVAIISGHGPTSTIGHERATNPFLQ
jgi:glyoxylase-like metal-dependent hydrolase (beta-lactamase superfamily II)